jgi:5'-3' exonuclease
MPARLHLVDGTFELYRAHYAPRPDRPKKATVGLVRSLLGLLAEKAEAVTHLAIAFDNPIRSFRNDLFEAYKSDEGVPADLRAQFDEAEAAARAVGVVVWSMKEFETDDAIATACARFAADFGQCLRGERVVQIDRIRKKTTDEKAMRALRGFGPASVPDWLALVGDTSDGIPGLPGFGDKSAAALLGRFEHAERIPDDWQQWPAQVRGREKLAKVLAEGRDEVALYKDLATLRTDVPLAESADDLRFAGTPPTEFAGWCERYAAPDLAGRAQPPR